MGSRGQAFAFGLVLQEPSGPVQHLWNGSEIHDHFTIRTAYLPMFWRILDQHATFHCSHFERSHDMSVAVTSTNEAQADFCGRRRQSEHTDICVSTKCIACFPVTVPVVPIKRQKESSFRECPAVGDPFSIGAPTKVNVWLGS